MVTIVLEEFGFAGELLLILGRPSPLQPIGVRRAPLLFPQPTLNFEENGPADTVPGRALAKQPGRKA